MIRSLPAFAFGSAVAACAVATSVAAQTHVPAPQPTQPPPEVARAVQPRPLAGPTPVLSIPQPATAARNWAVEPTSAGGFNTHHRMPDHTDPTREGPALLYAGVRTPFISVVNFGTAPVRARLRCTDAQGAVTHEAETTVAANGAFVVLEYPIPAQTQRGSPVLIYPRETVVFCRVAADAPVLVTATLRTTTARDGMTRVNDVESLATFRLDP